MVFLATQTYEWSLYGLVQAENEFGWRQAMLVVDGARDGARPKD